MWYVYSVLFLILSTSLFADEVYLKNGTTVRGMIVNQTRDSIRIISDGNAITFSKREIRRVVFVDDEAKKREEELRKKQEERELAEKKRLEELARKKEEDERNKRIAQEGKEAEALRKKQAEEERIRKEKEDKEKAQLADEKRKTEAELRRIARENRLREVLKERTRHYEDEDERLRLQYSSGMFRFTSGQRVNGSIVEKKGPVFILRTDKGDMTLFAEDIRYLVTTTDSGKENVLPDQMRGVFEGVLGSDEILLVNRSILKGRITRAIGNSIEVESTKGIVVLSRESFYEQTNLPEPTATAPLVVGKLAEIILKGDDLIKGTVTHLTDHLIMVQTEKGTVRLHPDQINFQKSGAKK